MRDSGKGSLVTVGQIADLAAVGASAVSNWRRRFGDFPEAVQTAPGGRDLFGLEDVQRWLEQHGRLSGETGSKRLIFEAADLLRSQVAADTMVETLGAALSLAAIEGRRHGHRLGGRDAEALLAAIPDSDLAEALRPLLEVDRQTAQRVLGLVLGIDTADLVECFDWVLSLGHKSLTGQSGDTLTALLVALIGGEGGVIYDPAAGFGGFLSSLWRSSTADERPELFAQEIGATAWRIARQKALVEDIPVSLVCGDSLLEDAWPELKAEIVVCDPPYRTKKSWPADSTGDPRWLSGRPPSQTDFAWLQHVAFHLSEAGHGYVFLPAGSLFRRGREADLRRELLLEEVVEAIISLPPRSAHGTGIALALWVLRPRTRDGENDSVLLVDPMADDSLPNAVLDRESINRVAEVMGAWRGGSEISERDRAVATSVSILDLLRHDVNLSPVRWLGANLTAADHKRRVAELVENTRVLNSSSRALIAAPELSIPSPDRSPRSWIQLDRLVSDGAAQVIGGVRIKAEDCLPAGSPVIRARDVVAGLERKDESCFVDLGAMRPQPALTLPGDVVLSAAGGRLTAAVDSNGGHVLAAPLQGLRLMRGSMDLDPELVAAFLESPRNSRLARGSTMATVDLRELEVPILPSAEARDLAAALDGLRERQRLAGQVDVSARRLREILLDFAASSFDTRRQR